MKWREGNGETGVKLYAETNPDSVSSKENDGVPVFPCLSSLLFSYIISLRPRLVSLVYRVISLVRCSREGGGG